MRDFSPLNPEVAKLFKKHFGFTPTHVVQAPAGLQLLGSQGDYNQGLTLAVATDKHVFVASSPRTDGRIELVSSTFSGNEVFPLHDLKRNPAAPWADCLKGVLVGLRKHGVHFRGFNAAIHDAIPLGVGLTSSAPLAVAAALTIRRMCPYTLTATGSTIPPKPDAKGELPPPSVQEKIEIAKLCQAAEQQLTGVQSGLLSPVASLFGKSFHTLELDGQSLAVEQVPMFGEVAIVICGTGVKHDLAKGEQEELRRHCEAAAQALGVKSLRAVDPKFLASNKGRLTERQYQCAYHIAGENQRVLFGSRALREDDFAQFGQYLLQSHESLRDFLKSSAADFDLLVELARAHPGCLGARLTGEAFGGATINLVKRDQAQNFIQAMGTEYEQRTGRRAAPMLCLSVDGAR